MKTTALNLTRDELITLRGIIRADQVRRIEDGEPLDNNHGIEDVAFCSVLAAEDDLRKFYDLCVGAGIESSLNDNWPHDFWLTRNHHGAGFWDGDYENGDKLTEVAEAFKEIYAYVGDDGLIYIE